MVRDLFIAQRVGDQLLIVDGSSQTVRTFLNRVLGLELRRQQLLFEWLKDVIATVTFEKTSKSTVQLVSRSLAAAVAAVAALSASLSTSDRTEKCVLTTDEKNARTPKPQRNVLNLLEWLLELMSARWVAVGQ